MKRLTSLSLSLRRLAWGAVLPLLVASTAWAQPAKNRPVLGVLSLDAVNVTTPPVILGNMVRLEVERMNRFEVLDRYELGSTIQSPKAEGCYGKTCLVDVGKAIHADKMLSGSIENYEKKYVLTLRMIDVASASVERTQVTEFLPLQLEVQSMVEVSVRQFFDMPVDSVLRRRLTQPSDYDNVVNTQNAPRLNTTGPRMGYALITGATASILKDSKENGGFNANPYLFQFGYQFETMYLNTGNWQALFEFVPTITGLDQGLFIPSLTVLNGLRHNLSGWEFALGPTFRISQEAEGSMQNGKFVLKSDRDPSGTNYVKRIDSRGDPTINTGVVIALGKTFRSGRLNLPVNFYYVPGKDHQQFGLSFGFNARAVNGKSVK